MARCLTLARRANGRTSPNPVVGCVIVGKSQRILAEGWHRRAGAPHAEVDALAKLGGNARGATLYVNLEPCAHTSARRTKPCVPLLLSSGISRLVFGLHDPFPGHGGGLAKLAQAGIVVDGPLLEPECRNANRAFITYATCGRAHFTLKAAMTLDGRIATGSGESRWITGETARAHAHRLRNQLDAILVGVGTVLADDPLLTTRGVRGGRDPVRIILDPSLRTPPSARMLHSGSKAPTMIVAASSASPRRERALVAVGAEILRLPARRHVLDMNLLAKTLAEREILHVLVEGGAETHARFLEAELCDQLLLYVAPGVIGGHDALTWLGGRGIMRLASMPRFSFDGPPKRLGNDLLLSATPRRG